MNRRQAIELKCKDCIYDPKQKGTWRQQVEACEITTCPLWIYRAKPVRKKNEDT